MSREAYPWIVSGAVEVPPFEVCLRVAQKLFTEGDLALSAAAYDRAYALRPDDRLAANERRTVLDRLAADELSIHWRYVPEGPFSMGAEGGDADELPVHTVEVGPFWIADIPLTWRQYHHLRKWPVPPALSQDAVAAMTQDQRFAYGQGDRMRRVYSLDRRKPPTTEELPMVATEWEDLMDLCNTLTQETPTWRYRLPTEAEWEKAARGALQGQPFPWGSAAPSKLRADHDNLEGQCLQDPRQYPANGYGLHAMSGSVWEWCLDWYDAEAYAGSLLRDPQGPADGKEKVLRGGSWADCEDVLRVSFRWAMGRKRYPVLTPGIGARLVRVARSTGG